MDFEARYDAYDILGEARMQLIREGKRGSIAYMMLVRACWHVLELLEPYTDLGLEE